MTDRCVLVDTDTGVDDALALLTVAHHPGTEIVGVGTAFGNCTERQAARNALTVLSVAGLHDVPVCIGQPRPGPPPATSSPHGLDGLGDRGYRPPPGVYPAPESAVDQLLRVAEDRPGAVDLLCLGPLANIAAAVTRDPRLLTRYRSVTVMGGMGTASRRGVEAAVQPQFLGKGDTNTNHDPGAATVVAAAPGQITWVGMNVTGRLRLAWADLVARSAVGKTATFVRDITEDYHRYCTSTYRAENPIYTAHDSVAAAVMLDPAVVLAADDAQPRVRHEDGRAAVWGVTPVRGPAHRFVTDLDYGSIGARIAATLDADIPRSGAR
ncbi:nucleoside hydrolase [Rhodococcus sp. JS3073]|uniref:nucleoside hydrolase n=1 Tax=Rhodococcus sp. JS3073 TaxID=3002901 RepID=UPI0022856F77|nr:nucleoside hydrolase [Rhodococcus sp. JS3073]WAM15024.1 nucleoside hydrolase [Rhodococcus sp. JS3073]